MRFVGAVLAMVLLVAACGDTPAATTSAPSFATEPSTVITAITTDFEQTWDPAWAPSDDLLAGFEAALRDAGIWALLPTEASPTGPSLSADAEITSTVPTNHPALSVVLRRADLSVFVSVQTAPLGAQPACDTRLDDRGGVAWAAQVVRGANGCSLLVDGAVSFLEWSENGQFFHAEFGPEVEVDELVGWFDTWRPIATR